MLNCLAGYTKGYNKERERERDDVHAIVTVSQLYLINLEVASPV